MDTLFPSASKITEALTLEHLLANEVRGYLIFACDPVTPKEFECSLMVSLVFETYTVIISHGLKRNRLTSALLDVLRLPERKLSCSFYDFYCYSFVVKECFVY
ncbi:hypothetical protein NPIL_352111 [Nephila pilipes]|uniref:Uncharacterized protein n=1 Tax=Nephila pilipes TaxID=299642 RepID=A0A8X6QC93_NEPPI|nr:hypothetical protein NPIL_352111 [Nephila pilipes]